MKAFVVMGNDFPDAVFSDETRAEAYCEAKRINKTPTPAPRIYWRVYEFEIDGKSN